MTVRIPVRQVLGASVRRTALAGLLTLATACATTQLDSLPDEPGGRGYRVGMVLELVVDQLLFPAGPGSTLLYLDQDFHGCESWLCARYVHATVEEYQRNPAAFPQVIGLLPAGTRIVVTRIELHSYPGLDDWYEVHGRATTSHLAGREMELRVKSERGKPPLNDPKLFEIIE